MSLNCNHRILVLIILLMLSELALISLKKPVCLSNTVSNWRVSAPLVHWSVVSVCLCALVSLCEEQIEDRCSSRGEEEEEDAPVVPPAPDASLRQEQPAANADVSSPLQHLDGVIHTYRWTGPKTVLYLTKTQCLFLFRFVGIVLDLQSQMCSVEISTGHKVKNGMLLMQEMHYAKYLS